MRNGLATFVGVMLWFMACSVRGQESFDPKDFPYTLFYPPLNNHIHLEKQKIDYDLSEQSALRLGPYLLADDSVSLEMSKEQGEFYEMEFGFELKRRRGPVYVISFRWPLDYLDSGFLEIINDKGESYWRREVTTKDVTEWKELVLDGRELTEEEKQKVQEKLIENSTEEQLGLARPKALSRKHSRSVFGLAHRNFFEVPIGQIREPFRYCLNREEGLGRVAFCSRRYQFVRRYGQYTLRALDKRVKPRVLVNDKPMALKGTVVFLDYKTPIKFSALLASGAYYEFISAPKKIELVDIIHHKEESRVEVIGLGDQPMGQTSKHMYADTVHWGFLNFMPTIGDLKQYWRASFSTRQPFLYIKGDGGAPFRQGLTFDTLPSMEARATLKRTTQRTTYNDRVWLEGEVGESVKLESPDSKVRRLEGREFEWEFLSPKRGAYNKDSLIIEEEGKKWVSEYEIYRGYPGEISARVGGAASAKLDFIFVGEVAAQYWFEKLLFLDNYILSNLRWGLSGKHFKNVYIVNDGQNTQDIVELEATNVDLKYRLTPGIWGRDPSLGLMFSYQENLWSFRQSGTEFVSTNSLVGGGVFWARSMPEFFDRIFNIIPWFRYPKWVDVEMVWYPIALESEKTPIANITFNFHGKVLWTERFFGEAGFGLKTLNYDDPTIGRVVNGKTLGKKIAFAVAYGTVGVGFNF